MSERKAFPLIKELHDTRPYAAKYAQIYGPWALMSKDWNDAKIGKYGDTEHVYNACLEKGVTWQELLDYKPDEKMIL